MVGVANYPIDETYWFYGYESAFKHKNTDVLNKIIIIRINGKKDIDNV